MSPSRVRFLLRLRAGAMPRFGQTRKTGFLDILLRDFFKNSGHAGTAEVITL
jgi:hypothetical protein